MKDSTQRTVSVKEAQPLAAIRSLNVSGDPNNKLLACTRCLESWPTESAMAAIEHTERCGKVLK